MVPCMFFRYGTMVIPWFSGHIIHVFDTIPWVKVLRWYSEDVRWKYNATLKFNMILKFMYHDICMIFQGTSKNITVVTWSNFLTWYYDNMTLPWYMNIISLTH